MIKKFGVIWPDCTVKIIPVKAESIVFTTIARLKCYQCGAFKRKKPCPPFNRSVKFYKEKFSKYKKIYIIYMDNDGTMAWRDGLDPNKLEKKVNKGLKGVAKGMPLSLHKLLLQVKQNSAKTDIYMSGSCSLCRPCNVKGKCLKGGFAHSPEGSGIDVITTLRNLNLAIEDIPFKHVVNVGIVGIRS
jgi:predicted metal-binding protein